MLTSQLQHHAPQRRRPARWLLGILFAYTVTGFLILPPIVRVIATKQLAKQLNRPVSIRAVRLNPFVFSATIRGLLVKDPDGQPFLSWDELYVNLQLTSFLSHPWVFKEISLARPFARAQMNKDGSLNFSDLLARFSASASAPPASPSRPQSLRVDLLHISGATAQLTDLTPRTPFHRLAGPLDFTLRNFRTDPDSQNPYAFSGTTEAGETLTWSGSFCFDPLRFQGDLSLENLALNKYQPLYQDLVRFEIRDGLLNLRATYHWEPGVSNVVATLTNASLALRNFKLGAPGNDTNLVELSELSIGGASADFSSRNAALQSIHLEGARVCLERNPTDGLNLANLARPAESASAPGGVLLLLRGFTNAVNQLLSSTNAWTASLGQAEIRNAALHFIDLTPSRPARLDLDDIQLDAAHFSNLPGSIWTATLSLRCPTNGTFLMDARASLLPLSADVHLDVHQLDLHPLGPCLEPWLNIVILQSELSLQGSLSLRATNSLSPVVTFQGDLGLDHLATLDGALGEDLLNWSSLHFSGIDASLNPPAIRIREIDLNDATARVLIETNRTINLLAALRPPESRAPDASTAPAPAPLTAPATEPLADSAASATPLISIGAVVISNAAVRFMDRSVMPPVSASVQQIHGTVSELSSETMGHATVDLQARIDTVGQARIRGTINPFSKQKSNELSIVVQDVDLVAVSPYAGKFAGYRIAKGKLGMNLAYHLQGRSLRAENQVTLDHFSFGDRVQSPDATSLPVRLAIAILKDRNGRIQLDVPVDGSLDDPDFRVRKVVLHTIVNLLTRVATSPFSLLGSVFGGRGEEVRYQLFTPGSAELPPSEQSKLDALVHGLYERPGLQLEIQGSVDLTKDRDGLRSRLLDANLRAAYWASLGKSARAQTRPESVTLSPDDRSRWIKKLYAKALEDGHISSQPAAKQGSPGAAAPPALYQSTQPLHGATRLLRSQALPATPAAPASSITVAADPFEQALLNSIEIQEADFESLASDRARTVRDYLLRSGKVEAERLFLADTQPGGLKAEGPRAFVQFR